MMCGEERDVSDSFSFPSRVMGCAPRHCGPGAFPGKESSIKTQLDPFSGNGAGGRELLLPISMCCVCPSLHVAGKKVPVWCLQHCFCEGTVGSLQVADL